MRAKEDILLDLAKAVLKRRTSQGRINKTIDAFAEDNPTLDEALHFVNEVVIHKHYKQHIHNTIKYKGVEKILKQLSGKYVR